MQDVDTSDMRRITDDTAARLLAEGHPLAADPAPFQQVVEVPHAVYQREGHRLDEQERQRRKAHRQQVEASLRRNRTRRKR